jgi:branched-chain amino acid transport system permease protein
MSFFLHIAVLICIYSILAGSLDMLWGYSGILSFGHAAFFGIGAYVTSLLMVAWGWNFFLTLPVAFAASFLIALLMLRPALKLFGSYFILACMAFQLVVVNVLENWTEVTRGPYGIPGIPRPAILGFSFTSDLSYFFLVVGISGLMMLIMYGLLYSPFGRVLKGVKDEPLVMEMLGKNVDWIRLEVFGIGSGIAAIGGSLYAAYIGYIDPYIFLIPQTVFIMAIMFTGGPSTLFGSIVGAVILVGIPEVLRFIGLPQVQAGFYQQMFYGALLVLLMLFRPSGILGPSSRGRK